MPFYTKNGSYPESLPYKIRLSNGLTRTDPTTFTPEEIADAGYVVALERPIPNSVQIVDWDSESISWKLRDKTLEELRGEKSAIWSSIRAERSARIAAVSWRYERWHRLNRLGLEQIDDIAKLDKYVQALADIPQNQTDPYDIVWPVLS